MKHTNLVLTHQDEINFMPLKNLKYGDYFMFDEHLYRVIEITQYNQECKGYYDVNECSMFLDYDGLLGCGQDEKVEVLKNVQVRY